MITDAQVHLFEPDRPGRPWPRDPGRPKPLVPSFSAEQMIAAMDEAGVDRAVIVPPVWAGDHNDYAFEACEAYPGRFAIMGRIDPMAPDTPQRLETWLRQPNMLGIRLSSKWGTRPEGFIEMLETGMLEDFWASCERLDIPLMCLTREAIAHLGPVAARHPHLKLIVDHLSTVHAAILEQAFSHLDDLLELARYPNVCVKLGTAPHHSREDFPFWDVHTILRRVYDAYGRHRMLWEADITQLTNNTYGECLRLWQEGLPFLSDSDREWILGGAAAEVLRWPED